MAKEKTQTATFSGGNAQCYSRWQCKAQSQSAGGTFVFVSGPTVGAARVSISYSIPSGSKIKSAKITASYISPLSGISMLTLNGGSFRGSANANVSGTSGTYTCSFTFKANGTKTDEVPHVATLSLTNIVLTITYEGEKKKKQKKGEEVKFRIPPQSVCIYDQEDKQTYSFDGVVKTQQNMSLKIEEDPSKKKELYVNNARNEPDKVTLDVMMSDVYTGEGSFITQPGLEKESTKSLAVFKGTSKETRSARAAAALHKIKESRHMMTVITPQYVYKDMLLQAVVITQDDSCPFGWTGQLTFQEKYEIIQKKDKTSSVPTATGGETPTESGVSATAHKVWGTPSGATPTVE